MLLSGPIGLPEPRVPLAFSRDFRALISHMKLISPYRRVLAVMGMSPIGSHGSVGHFADIKLTVHFWKLKIFFFFWLLVSILGKKELLVVFLKKTAMARIFCF